MAHPHPEIPKAPPPPRGKSHEIQLESKWDTTFESFQPTISDSKGTSEQVVLLFWNGTFQMEIRVPFVQSLWNWFVQIVNAIPGRN